MSSYDGSRSARQSKRYSMSALYMSMSANEGDLQIEDELAKGMMLSPSPQPTTLLTLCPQPKKLSVNSSPRSPRSPRRTSSSRKMCDTSTRVLLC